MNSVHSQPLTACALPRASRGRTHSLHATRTRTLCRVAHPKNNTSLIPETLREMQDDEQVQRMIEERESERAAERMREETAALGEALRVAGTPTFAQTAPTLTRRVVDTLQINIGLYCNQACNHCHVESSPLRTEAMSDELLDHVIELCREGAKEGTLRTLDITGGAPELHPGFRRVVQETSQLGIEVIDRCNLTVLMEPGQEDLADFLAEHKVRVVASLPCYSAENVDAQRGFGVFERSIAALQRLNDVGYGVDKSLALDLVYNPGGPFLPPPQEKLEVAYRTELGDLYGIVFTSLLALTNVPIKRYADRLIRRGELQAYMELLASSYNSATLSSVMCTYLLSVRHDGALFDCDFNAQIEMPMAGRLSLLDVSSLADERLLSRPVVTGNHCFACTAGAGSS